MRRNIVAIGGGELRSGVTLPIDRLFVALANVERPNLLFIPTASMDSEDYAAAVRATYGDRLGCEVDVLRLYSEDQSPTAIVSKLAAADLIYVGGGNTKAMLEKWAEFGVDSELRRVVGEGKPVGGLSAGAICWFRVGNSDWPQFEQIPGVLTARLDCLGIVDLVVCPHTKEEAFRLDEFHQMMKSETGIGLGLDDCCAIQIRDDEYRILRSNPDARAHLLFARNGEIVHEILEAHDDFRALSELHNRAVG